MAQPADIGLIGLGVMGQNLALNIVDHGFRVAVHNRSPDRTDAFLDSEAARGRDLIGCPDLDLLVDALRPPRPVILMVKAGEPTDWQIDLLMEKLAPGDIVIDGGNAHFADTIRRERALRHHELLFLGTGISGGEEGARRGPSIMVGGEANAFERIRPIFERIAAQVDGEPCCAHCGPDGSGHFVKMLHNGIEYADMQLIGEAYALMRDALGFDYPAMQRAFAEWDRGDLDSYLIEITADILGHRDPETGEPMVEVILDKAGQKGTGAWSVAAALDLGVPAPVIAEAVAARSLSAAKDERVRAAAILEGVAPREPLGGEGLSLEDLRDALLSAKICAYAQGFAVMAAASRAHHWNLDLGRIAAIWRGGCIIRARFLERIREAFERDPALPNLLLDSYFTDHLAKAQAALRKVVATACRAGTPVPALASALAYLDGYRSARLPANLLQAQRDYFGAHTYQRVDRPGTFHTEWQTG